MDDAFSATPLSLGDVLNIAIADINFRISCADRFVNTVTYSNTYAPFITEASSSAEGAVSIDLGIELDNIPDTGKMTKIFDTLESWSMYRSGDEYFWVDATDSFPREDANIARFRSKPERVTVYSKARLLAEIKGQKTINNPFVHPLDQLLMMYVLAKREGAILHACAVELDGKGFILPGRSGAGKTTISRLFAAKGHNLLSDDRVVARKIESEFYAFGTPWAGEANIAANRSLPLHGIFFIMHGNENRIDKITVKEAFEKLMPVTSIPWYDEKVMPDILSFCEDIVMNVPAYELHFRPDCEVVTFLEDFIARNNR